MRGVIAWLDYFSLSPSGEGLGWRLSAGECLGETPVPPPTPPLKGRGL
jgi:hypothetical protein